MPDLLLKTRPHHPPCQRQPRRCAATATTVALVNAIMLAGVAQAQTSTNAPVSLEGVTLQAEKPAEQAPLELSSPKYTVPLRDIPQTITVVNSTIMEQRNATNLRDVLRNVPGISIQAGEGGAPAGDQLSIRGFSARTDLFIDGVRDFGGYSRDPFNFEQVEVVKGPSSSTSGRGSTGGSINMVSKSPSLDNFYNGSVGFGTDNYKRATFDINQSLEGNEEQKGIEGAAFRVNGLFHDANTPGRDFVNESRWGIAPSLAFGLDTPTRVTLSYFHLEQDNLPDYGIPWVPAGNFDPTLSQYIDQAPPVDFSNFYGLIARDYERINTDLITSEVEHDLTDQVTLRNITRYGRTRRDSVITAPRFADQLPAAGNQSTTVLNRQIQSRDQYDSILANQLNVTAEFGTGSVAHTLSGGIDFSHETETRYLTAATSGPSAQTDIFNPTPDDAYLDGIARDGRVNQSVVNSTGLYVFDTMELGDQWLLNGGLRWDYLTTGYETTAPPAGAQDFGREDRVLSWQSGVVYKPRENGNIFFGYGTSFNPAGEGLTLSAANNNAANFSVDPEKSRTFELGTRWDFFNSRLTLSTAVFRTDKTNARTEDPTDPTDVVVLEGKQHVQGIELGVAGEITEGLNLSAGYTFLDSEIKESRNAAEIGNELSNTPRHSVSLWTTYEFPWKLELGVGNTFVGDRFSNNANSRTAPGYWVHDAMAGYQINEHLTLRLNVNNLANNRYIDSVGGGHFIPGAGRSAVLTASVSF